jgi:NADH dehydrogenase/NADH:ubiquinone oxidoreductase subunit G
MIQFKIDGKEVTASEGSTILQVAKANGIDIPTFCHHEALAPWSACRLCLVEVNEDGRTRLVTSCSFQVKSGLAVTTENKSIRVIRKMIIELLLARCPNAQAVRQMADKLGVTEPRFTIENEFCILCGMCVRVCREVVGAQAITFADRGSKKRVASPFFKHSGDCIGCGACVFVCPTQCITMDDVADVTDVYAEGTEQVGYARVMNNWRTRLPLKVCKSCGNPIAPEFQLQVLAKKAGLAPDALDLCQGCKE